MDWTPIYHASAALAAQILVGLAAGDWLMGGVLGCCWFAAREHTQAEYRWIAQFGRGQRANMPWWGGFDPRAWTWASVLDAIGPVAACSLFYLTALEAVF